MLLNPEAVYGKQAIKHGFLQVKGDELIYISFTKATDQMDTCLCVEEIIKYIVCS